MSGRNHLKVGNGIGNRTWEVHEGRQMCRLCREMRDEIQKLTVSDQGQLLASPMHSVDDVNKALASLGEPQDEQEQHAKLPQTFEARQAHNRDPPR